MGTSAGASAGRGYWRSCWAREFTGPARRALPRKRRLCGRDTCADCERAICLDQGFRQRLVVGNIQEVLGGPVPFQFGAEFFQRRPPSAQSSGAICARRTSNTKRGSTEARISPLDLLLRPRRDGFEDRVQPAQVWWPARGATRM